jgi:hypothetical protein
VCPQDLLSHGNQFYSENIVLLLYLNDKKIRKINMKFLNHSKNLILVLLVFLNILIRIPSTPHETGADGFTTHIIANSISEFGYLKNLIHPLSIFGFYPYSYGSAVHFILSGISQSSGTEMELAIWLFSVVIGILSIFTAYLMAGIIWDNDFFKFLVALIYSTAPGVLIFTTWEASTRGLFIVLLPLFIYLLLKTYESRKYIMLIFIFFILLAVTHKLVFITLPFIFCLVFVSIISKLKFIKIENRVLNMSYILSFLLFFTMPFFTRFLIKGERYAQLWDVLFNNLRYTGLPLLFTIGGFVYLSTKHNKDIKEWYFLVSLVLLAPFFWEVTYSQYITIVFASVLFGIALMNLYKYNKQLKYASYFIILILLLSVSFSDFFQHWRPNTVGRPSNIKWYLDEESYASALWIKDDLTKNNRLISNDPLESRRIFAISEVPSLMVEGEDVMLIYGFINLTSINVTQNSPLTTDFYKFGPYVLDSGNEPEVGWYFDYIQSWDVDSYVGKSTISNFDLDYVVQNKNINENNFTRSLYMKKDAIYDNNNIKIWTLR